MPRKVKERRRTSRISTKNQITLPVDALRKTGLGPGDELVIEPGGAGRLVLARADDVIGKYAGTLGYPDSYLDRLRDEWR
jgi:bifunctional DNA-binding transcriptional regulator/antitoxin component of YhaV-PrlF toxin-antitoxin module